MTAQGTGKFRVAVALLQGAAGVALFSLSSCSNGSIGGAHANSTGGILSQITQAISPNSYSGVAVNYIIHAQESPSTEIEGVGDGSNVIASSCPLVTPTDPTNPYKSTCQCYFQASVVQADGTSITQFLSSDTTYLDPNTFRCPFFLGDPSKDFVPNVSLMGKVTFVQFQLYIGSTSLYTKPILPSPLNPPPGVPVYFNNFVNAVSASLETNASSFRPVVRHQCVESGDIVDVLDIKGVPYTYPASGQANPTAILDPFAVIDRRIYYPLNFYTTNVYNTMGLYTGLINLSNGANSTGTSQAAPGIPTGTDQTAWLCSFKTPDLEGVSDPTNVVDTTLGIDFRLYSKAPVTMGITDQSHPSGSATGNPSQIYPPPSGFFDRYSFSLMSQPTQNFTIPVPAQILPTVVSTLPVPNPSSTPALGDLLGYAAPLTKSGNQETCPDAPIPPGYQWVKLYVAYASLPPRFVAKPAHFIAEIASPIYCNPGSRDSTGAPTVADCGSNTDSNPLSAINTQALANSSTNSLSDRVILDNNFSSKLGGDFAGAYCLSYKSQHNLAMNGTAAGRLSSNLGNIDPTDSLLSESGNMCMLDSLLSLYNTGINSSKVPPKGPLFASGTDDFTLLTLDTAANYDCYSRYTGLIGSPVPNSTPSPLPGYVTDPLNLCRNPNTALARQLPAGSWTSLDTNTANPVPLPTPAQGPITYTYNRVLYDATNIPNPTTPNLNMTSTSSQSIDSIDHAVARPEFVFVVTPPSVQSQDLFSGCGSGGNSAQALACETYMPYRYPKGGGCPSGNYSSGFQTDVDCDPSNVIQYLPQVYGLDGQSAGAQQYPVCAIQKIPGAS